MMVKEKTYDDVSDFDDRFSSEFKRYMRDENLICSYIDYDWPILLFKKQQQWDGEDSALLDLLKKVMAMKMPSLGCCLVQFWKEEEESDFRERHFKLSTCNRPFLISGRNSKVSEEIYLYRMKMIDIVSGDGGAGRGKICRVFWNKRMEFTPSISYYSTEEYPIRDFALSCGIKASLAIPWSNSSGRVVGVLEIVSQCNSSAYFLRSVIIELRRKSSLRYLALCNDMCGQYDLELGSLQIAQPEINEVMKVVDEIPGVVCAQTWILCNNCESLSTSKRIITCESDAYNRCRVQPSMFLDVAYVYTLKKGEGVVGKAAESRHDLIYCDNVSKLSIIEYPIAHFARDCKLTSSFVTSLRSDLTGRQIYILEFFFSPSIVNEQGLTATLIPILQTMRKKFQTFRLASGKIIGDDLSVKVIDAQWGSWQQSVEIGCLNSVENHMPEIDLNRNEKNVVNTAEERSYSIALLDQHYSSSEISGNKTGRELAVSVRGTASLEDDPTADCLAMGHGQNVSYNSRERDVVIAPLEKEYTHSPISTNERVSVVSTSQQPLVLETYDEPVDFVGWSQQVLVPLSDDERENDVDSSLQPLVPISDDRVNVVGTLQQPVVTVSDDEQVNDHTEENVVGTSEDCTINSSNLPKRRGGINISFEELEKVSGMKRKDAAEKLKVSISTFKRACRDYNISRWPPRKRNTNHLSGSGNSAQTDSMKELGSSAPTVENESFVTIKAKYGDMFIKFQLSPASGINVFYQQVRKRLNLEAETYTISYQDEDDDAILISCDEDLQAYISSSNSLGKTNLVMTLEHI